MKKSQYAVWLSAWHLEGHTQNHRPDKHEELQVHPTSLRVKETCIGCHLVMHAHLLGSRIVLAWAGRLLSAAMVDHGLCVGIWKAHPGGKL